MDELRQQLNAMHQSTIVQLNYAKTMVLLRALKAGTVKIENVFIDGDNWNIVDVIETPVGEPVGEPG